MDLNPVLGESTAVTVGAAGADVRGQGDAKIEPSLKNEVKVPSSAGGTEATGPSKEAVLLNLKMAACSLENAREESLAKKQAKRRAAWKEDVEKELAKRVEFKRKMEAVPMEQVPYWMDKVTMSKMSSEWREGFKRERTSFLYYEVFPLLLKTPQIYTINELPRCLQILEATH